MGHLWEADILIEVLYTFEKQTLVERRREYVSIKEQQYVGLQWQNDQVLHEGQESKEPDY